MSTEPKKLVGGKLITSPRELIDFYQLGDFQHQFQTHQYISRVGTCRSTDRCDELARRVSPGNPIRVLLIDKPIPRDPNRFRYLSPDKPAVMQAGAKFPSPEELARQSLDHMVETHDNRIDGN